MLYKVKLAYGPDYFFDNIEEAAAFFDQAIRHAEDDLKWAALEPIYPEPDAEDVNAEEVSDD